MDYLNFSDNELGDSDNDEDFYFFDDKPTTAAKNLDPFKNVQKETEQQKSNQNVLNKIVI